MLEEQPNPWSIELKKYDSRDEYYAFPFPEKAKELPEVQPEVEHIQELKSNGVSGSKLGDKKNDILYSEVVEPEDAEKPNYIYFGFDEDVSQRKKRVLSENTATKKPEFRMTCPKSVWLNEANPLNNADEEAVNEGDEEDVPVIMELNLKGNALGATENHFRVYKKEDYLNHRFEDWKDYRTPVSRSLPVLGGLFNRLYKPQIDLSGPYSGQQVCVVPFPIYHPVFTESNDQRFDPHHSPDPEQVLKLGAEGRLPQIEVEELHIEWDPFGTRRGFDGRVVKRHTRTSCKEVDTVLPTKGRIQFRTVTKSGEFATSIARFSEPAKFDRKDRERVVGDNWHGIYHSESVEEDCLYLYAPAISQG